MKRGEETVALDGISRTWDLQTVGRDLARLFTVAAGAGMLLVGLGLYIIGRVSYFPSRLILVPYGLFVIILPVVLRLYFRLYLHPLDKLARKQRRGEEIPDALLRQARRLAFAAPLHFLYHPTLLATGAATLASLIGGPFVPTLPLAHRLHFVATTALSFAVVSLLIATLSRRLLKPILLFTSKAECKRPHFTLRTRYSATTLMLLLVTVAMIGLAVFHIASAALLNGLRERYTLMGQAVDQIAAYVDDATLSAYVASLPVGRDVAFILASTGEFVTPLPSGSDLTARGGEFAQRLLAAPQMPVRMWSVGALGHEVLFVPLHGHPADGESRWWLGFAYSTCPFEMVYAHGGGVLLVMFSALVGLVFFVNRHLADDLAQDLEDVTRRIRDLAETEADATLADAYFEKLRVTSAGEVGRLVMAFNALLDRIWAQQRRLQREHKELKMLTDVLRSISFILDTDLLLHRIIAEFEETFGYKHMLILLMDEETRELYVAAGSQAIPPQLSRFRCAVDSTFTVGDVALTGRPLVVTDVPSERRPLLCGYGGWEETTGLETVRAELVVPMVVNERILGVFVVGAGEVNAFSERELRLVTAIANQAAMALHNAQLYREVEEQRRAASTMAEIAKVVNATLDLERVLNVALEQLARVVPYDTSAILLLQGEELVIAAGRGFKDPASVLGKSFRPEERNLGYTVMMEQRVQVVADVQRLPNWGHRREDIEGAHRIRSWIGAPLVVQGRSLGLLTLDKFEPNFYREKHGALVAAFAEQIAVAVHNASLYRTSQERAKELALLHEISQRISALMDVDALLEEVVRRVRETFGHPIVTVHLLDEDSGHLEFATYAGVEQLPSHLPRRLGDRGIVPWVAEHGRALCVPDVRLEPRYVPISPTIRSELAVPLKVGDQVIGVFNLESEEVDAFDEDDVRLMTALAHQIAVAIQNARLFENVRHQTVELAQLTTKLTEEKSRLRAILQNIADGLIVTDPRNVVILVNPAFEELLQRPAASVVGRSLSQVVREPELQHLVTRALEDRQATFTSEITTPAGRILKASASAIQDRGRVIGVVTVLRDVTREREVDRMKTEFISAVSHELRTPLTSVLGFAKLIGRALDREITPRLSAEDKHVQRVLRRVRNNLDIILVEGERLTRLVNDVLDIAKMESGKVEWKDRPLDVPTLIQRTVQEMQEQAQAKGLSLEMELPEHVPPVTADPDRIRQVLVNLLSNAIKFTDEGGVTVRLRVLAPGECADHWTAPKDGGGLLISVTDTGIGIPQKALPRLFKRFQQVSVDLLTDKPKGTGLGLAICRAIVTHYGGNIWVESTVGEGSTFSFTLPFRVAPVEHTERSIIAMARRQAPVALDSADEAAPMILVVDDEAHVRSLLVQELTSHGYRVLEAANGVEAIALARHHVPPPALIVMDVVLPDLSGFDVLRILKADPTTSFIPVLILSIIENRERGLALGADGYLVKPVDTDALLEAIAALLEGKPLPPPTAVSTLERVIQVLRDQGYRIIGAFGDRVAISHPVASELPALDELLAHLDRSGMLKGISFEGPSRRQIMLILVGESSPSPEEEQT